jgi:exodeoxyribonuclease III
MGMCMVFRLLRSLLVMAGALLAQPAVADVALRVMTLNMWGGGLHAGRSIADNLAALRAADADVLMLQETWLPDTSGCASEACVDNAKGLVCNIAAALGLHCHEQRGPAVRGAMAILSRHPVTGETASGLGVTLDVGGRAVAVFNVHLPDAPYQPYQIARIPYDGAPWIDTAEEAIASATAARGHVVDLLERELPADGAVPVIVGGDFNEPSHLDWTPHAVAAGQQPLAVAWPATRRLAALGFADAYRAAHPEETRRPGATWTALAGEGDKHDRIDFILARGPGLSVRDAGVIGEPGPLSDIAVAPWPSDHRGVAATLEFAAPLRTVSARAP